MNKSLNNKIISSSAHMFIVAWLLCTKTTKKSLSINNIYTSTEYAFTVAWLLYTKAISCVM